MLPKADLYICTGDMLPNFPILKFQVDKWKRDGYEYWDPNADLLGHPKLPPPENGVYCGRRIDPIREAGMQNGWLGLEQKAGGLRRWLASHDAPVITCRGNHDFTEFDWAFGGETYNVTDDPTKTFEVMGLKFG